MDSVNIPSVPRDALLTTCVVAGIDMDVEYTYEPPEYLKALTHGHCGLVEIHSVKLGEVELILVLNEETLQAIEDQLEDQRNCNFDY